MPTRPPTPCREPGCPGVCKDRSGYCSIHKSTYDRRRGSATKRGYGAQWRRLRARVLKEEPICRRCRDAETKVVDHIIPKPVGTDDRENLQGLCKRCHDEKTAREDGGFVGRPTSRVVLVAGPPGAGKSTLVERYFQRGDAIVDLDRLYVALSGLPVYDKPGALLPLAVAARDAVLDALAKPNAVTTAWILTGAPRPSERERFERRHAARVLVLETPPAECLRRIDADPRRKGKAELWRPLVSDWWTAYRRREQGDTVIPWQTKAAA